LVTYLPEPLGSFLTELRQTVAGEDKPEAHITFLPPRPLSLPVEQAALDVRQRLSGVEPFEVQLGAIRLFPRTNILYISLETGRGALLRLHDLLNQGSLFAREDFEFIPHLTLSGTLPASDIQQALVNAESAWKASIFPRRFLVSELVLLWQPGGVSERDWVRLSTYRLSSQSQSAARNL
jgi:2'-5' RNA ligase